MIDRKLVHRPVIARRFLPKQSHGVPKMEIAFPKNRDLLYLLSLVAQKDNVEEGTYDKAAELQDFAVEIRYPDTVIDLSD